MAYPPRWVDITLRLPPSHRVEPLGATHRRTTTSTADIRDESKGEVLFSREREGMPSTRRSTEVFCLCDDRKHHPTFVWYLKRTAVVRPFASPSARRR